MGWKGCPLQRGTDLADPVYEGEGKRLIFRSAFGNFSISAASSPGSPLRSFCFLTAPARLAERRELGQAAEWLI